MSVAAKHSEPPSRFPSRRTLSGMDDTEMLEMCDSLGLDASGDGRKFIQAFATRVEKILANAGYDPEYGLAETVVLQVEQLVKAELTLLSERDVWMRFADLSGWDWVNEGVPARAVGRRSLGAVMDAVFDYLQLRRGESFTTAL